MTRTTWGEKGIVSAYSPSPGETKAGAQGSHVESGTEARAIVECCLLLKACTACWCGVALLAWGNQENAPTDVPVSDLIETFAQLKPFFPFELCQADRKPSQADNKPTVSGVGP